MVFFSFRREGGSDGEADQQVTRVVMRPLAPFADADRQKLEERGYTRLSAVNLQRQVAEMSRWLKAEQLGFEELSEACVEAFLAAQRARGRDRSSLSRRAWCVCSSCCTSWAW
jgi:hypothetical protein